MEPFVGLDAGDRVTQQLGERVVAVHDRSPR
jgi:hypothetical protein